MTKDFALHVWLCLTWSHLYHMGIGTQKVYPCHVKGLLNIKNVKLDDISFRTLKLRSLAIGNHHKIAATVASKKEVSSWCDLSRKPQKPEPP